MSRGFGATQPKRRNHKRSPRQKPSQVEQYSLETKTQPTLEEDWQINLEKQALAWRAGVYNPLFDFDPDRIRSIEADEEEWLFLARMIGWLEVDDELDALYFTAPPPSFDEIQANWYLRPVLTTFLEEPTPLKDVMERPDLIIFLRLINIGGCLILQGALQVEAKTQNRCNGGLNNEKSNEK